MRSEPTRPYVYQPDPPDPFSSVPPARQRIWSVGGPGTGIYTGVGQRYTRAEAGRIVESLTLRGHATPNAFLG